VNTCAPHFFIIITYLQHSQFKMQYYRVHCFVPGLAPVWYHRLVGQLPVPVHRHLRLRHIIYSRHLPAPTILRLLSSSSLLLNCMNCI